MTTVQVTVQPVTSGPVTAASVPLFPAVSLGGSLRAGPADAAREVRDRLPLGRPGNGPSGHSVRAARARVRTPREMSHSGLRAGAGDGGVLFCCRVRFRGSVHFRRRARRPSTAITTRTPPGHPSRRTGLVAASLPRVRARVCVPVPRRGASTGRCRAGGEAGRGWTLAGRMRTAHARTGPERGNGPLASPSPLHPWGVRPQALPVRSGVHAVRSSAPLPARAQLAVPSRSSVDDSATSGGSTRGSFPVIGGRYGYSLCPAVPGPSTVGVDWRQPVRLCHHQHTPLRLIEDVCGGFA